MIGFLTLQFDVMKDVGSSKLNPILNDISHVSLLHILLNHYSMLSNILNSVLGNQCLGCFIVVALVPDVLALKIVEERAFHAHCDEDLVFRVESPPSGF